MSETPKIDMAGGSLPNTRIRQTESLASDSSDCSLPASPDIPDLLRRLEMARGWVLRNFRALVTEDDGDGAFIRGTGREVAGFERSLQKALSTIHEAHAALAQMQEALEQAQSDFDSFAEHHRATEATLREAEARVQEIDCPLCGATVKQVASATLNLALWQHVNWVCPRRIATDEALARLEQKWRHYRQQPARLLRPSTRYDELDEARDNALLDAFISDLRALRSAGGA